MNQFTFILFTNGSNIHYGTLKATCGADARRKLETWATENGYAIKRMILDGVTSKTFTLNTLPWYADNAPS